MTEKKTYTITATPEVHRRLEMFLALMHYNAGHSAIFGMNFDGDGPDSLQVDPAPDPALATPVERIGAALDGLEYVSGKHYCATSLNEQVVYRYREFPDEGIDQLQRRRKGAKMGEIVHEWSRSAPTKEEGSPPPHVDPSKGDAERAP